MLKSILSTLSDSELISIAEEVNNSEVSKDSIIAQLKSKSNTQDGSDSVSVQIEQLPILVCLELSIRLKNANLVRCKCD